MATTTAMTGAGVLALEPARTNGSDSGTGDDGLFARTLEQVRQEGAGSRGGDGTEQHEAGATQPNPEAAGRPDEARVVARESAGQEDDGAASPDDARQSLSDAGQSGESADSSEVADAGTASAADEGEAVDALGLLLAQLGQQAGPSAAMVARAAAAGGVSGGEPGGDLAGDNGGQGEAIRLLPGGKNLPPLPPSGRFTSPLSDGRSPEAPGATSGTVTSLRPLATDAQQGTGSSLEDAIAAGDEGTGDAGAGRLNALHDALKAAVNTHSLAQGGRSERIPALAEGLQGMEPEAPQAAAGGAAGTPGVAPGNRAANASLPSFTVPQPMQNKGWDQAMGERMVWMARNSIQQARLQLNPRDMGPLEVRLSLNHDQATVHFVAQHSATRDALEQALPRLREMFQESGLNLAQSEVSQHDFRRRGEGSDEGAGRGGDGGADEVPVGQEGVLTGQTMLPDGAVDYYA